MRYFPGMGETQVNMRLPPDMLARVDGLGAQLGIAKMSRAWAAAELIRRGIEATDAGMQFVASGGDGPRRKKAGKRKARAS